MTLLAFMMPGPAEMLIIAIILVLLFGRKLPKLAFDMGNSFTQFKKGLKEPIEQMAHEVQDETDSLNREIVKQTKDCEDTARSR